MTVIGTQCMGWPTPAARCTSQKAVKVGHYLRLCESCQEQTMRDLKITKRKREDADRALKKLSRQETGWTKPPEAKPHPGFGWEVSGGLPSLGKDQ